MNKPTNDDELLAALLDGRVDEHRRQELLAHLSTSDDDRRVLSDTAAILRELEEPETDVGTVTDLAAHRRARDAGWRRAPVLWGGALAAVLAAIYLISAQISRGPGSSGDPVRLAARVGPGEGLPQGWTTSPRWDSTRGDQSPEGAVERAAQAARAGALLFDLAVAVKARNAADTRLLATQLRSRYDPRAGDAAPLSRLSARAGAHPDSLWPLVAEATERLSARLGTAPLQTGAWTEAGRLAAHRQDEGFFRTGASRTMLSRAEAQTARDPAAHAAAAQVRAAIETKGPPDWDALSSALNALLRELAN